MNSSREALVGAGAVPREVIIGLDVGTTATKAVAFSLDPQLPGWLYAASHHNTRLPGPAGSHEQDAAAVLSGVTTALQEVTAAITGSKVVAVSVSTAMHGLIGLDAHGQTVTPLITWADSRAVAQAQRLRDSGDAAAIYQASGSPVHPMTPLTKLMWFTENDPGLSSRVRVWAGLKDIVLQAMTGRLVTEASSASGTGLWDLATGWWNPSAAALAGIDADQLPPIVPTTAGLEMTGAFAASVGLPPGTPIVVGAGDGPLGNVGTRALHPGEVGLSVGTSGAVRMVVDEPLLDPHGRLFCYALTEDLWVVGGAISTGGAAMSWLQGLFGEDEATTSMPKLLAAAEQVPAGANGLLMLPYLLAERAPLWDAELPGAYLGIKAHHRREDFVRATVEGVAMQLAAVFEEINRLTAVNSVRATGGVFRSTLWRRTIAGALDRPLTITAAREGTALGAAALGLYALGRADDLSSAVDLLQSSTETAVAEPQNQDAEVYRQLRAAVPTLISAYSEVAELFRELSKN